jgi:GAG-pre-integrase domain
MVTKFSQLSWKMFNSNGKLTTVATRTGSLYCLDLIACQTSYCANIAKIDGDTWHRRHGNLGIQSLKTLACNNMVKGLEFSFVKAVKLDHFCELCAKEKHCRAPIPVRDKRADEPPGIVHSDVCGKLNKPSLSGAEYVLTFIDDKTCYTLVYFLKSKDQVFKRFT